MLEMIFENDNGIIETEIKDTPQSTEIEVKDLDKHEDSNDVSFTVSDASETLNLPNEKDNDYKQIEDGNYVSDEPVKDESVGSVVGPMIPQIGLDGKAKSEKEEKAEDTNEEVTEGADVIAGAGVFAGAVATAYGLYLVYMDCIKLLEKAGDNIVTAVQYPKYAKVLNAYYKYFIDGKAPEFKSLHRRKTFTDELGDEKNAIVGVLKKYGIGTECALVDYYEDKDEKDSVCGCYMEKKYKAHIDLFASVLSDATVIEYGWTKHIQPKVLKYKKYEDYYIAYMCLKLGFINNAFKDIMRDIKAELNKHKDELDKITKESFNESAIDYIRNSDIELSDVIIESTMNDASNIKLSVDLPQSLRKLCGKYSLINAKLSVTKDEETKKKLKKELVEVEKDLRKNSTTSDEKKGVNELKNALKAIARKETKKIKKEDVKTESVYTESMIESFRNKLEEVRNKKRLAKEHMDDLKRQMDASDQASRAHQLFMQQHEQAVREHQRLFEEEQRIVQQIQQQNQQIQQMNIQQAQMPFMASGNETTDGDVITEMSATDKEKVKSLEKRKNYWLQFKRSSENELKKGNPRKHPIELQNNISRAIREIKKIESDLTTLIKPNGGREYSPVYAYTDFDDIIGLVVTEYGFDELFDKYEIAVENANNEPTISNKNKVIGLESFIDSIVGEIFTEARNMEDEIEPYVKRLNDLGFTVKYASPGHIKLRKKTDVYRDGIYKGKLYSDARIMFDKEYNELSNKKAPENWKWRVVDGCTYLDVNDISYDENNGTPDEAFNKWKKDYLKSLDEFISALEKGNTPEKEDDKDESDDSINESVLESIDYMIDMALNK